MALDNRILRSILSAMSAAIPLSCTAIGAAQAQDAAAMSCDQLWYARNEIYAREGYCFETPHGQAVFGRRCYPPYGALSPAEKDRVNELQYWERRKGC